MLEDYWLWQDSHIYLEKRGERGEDKKTVFLLKAVEAEVAVLFL